MADTILDHATHRMFEHCNPTEQSLADFCLKEASIQHRETAWEYQIVIPYSGSFPVAAWVDFLREYAMKHFPPTVRYSIVLTKPTDFGRQTTIGLRYLKAPETNDGWPDKPDKVAWQGVLRSEGRQHGLGATLVEARVRVRLRRVVLRCDGRQHAKQAKGDDQRSAHRHRAGHIVARAIGPEPALGGQGGTRRPHSRPE